MSKRRKVGRHRTTPIRPLPFDVYAANKAVELSKLAWTGAGSISSNYPITVQRFKLRALVRKRKFVQLEDELGVPARPSVACSSVCYAWLSREKMCRMQAKETAGEKCENRIEIRFLIDEDIIDWDIRSRLLLQMNTEYFLSNLFNYTEIFFLFEKMVFRITMEEIVLQIVNIKCFQVSYRWFRAVTRNKIKN